MRLCEKVKVKDIFTSLNISDSWCKSKLERFNSIIDEFMIEAYDLQTLKVGQYFPNDGNEWTTIVPKYPIARLRAFYGDGCNLSCSLDKDSCCAWYKLLLLNEGYADALDNNEYALTCDEVRLKTSGQLKDGIMVYTRHIEHVHSLEDEIEIDSITLALLKLYMQSVYAIKEDVNTTTSQYYYNRFKDLLAKANVMMKNTLKYVKPGVALNRLFDWPHYNG